MLGHLGSFPRFQKLLKSCCFGPRLGVPLGVVKVTKLSRNSQYFKNHRNWPNGGVSKATNVPKRLIFWSQIGV